MSIGIICRHCGTRLKVAESAAGKLGKCPKCKEAIRVPKAVSPEAHFCDSCGKSLAKETDIHLVSGKIYCGKCFEEIDGNKIKTTGDSILDQIGIDIPGLVVLRGKEQRQMGRMLQDVSAKKDFKVKTGKLAKPETPEPPAGTEPARVAEEQVAEATESPAEAEVEPVEETPPAPAAPDGLTKGQRAADSLLTKLLSDQGVVLEGELELALQYQRGLGKRLIPVLDDLKLTSEVEIVKTIAESTGLERCPEGELDIADGMELLLDDEILSHYEVIPLESEGDALVVAFPNPLDVTAVQELRDALDTRVIPKVCMWSQYTEARLKLRDRR